MSKELTQCPINANQYCQGGNHCKSSKAARERCKKQKEMEKQQRYFTRSSNV